MALADFADGDAMDAEAVGNFFDRSTGDVLGNGFGLAGFGQVHLMMGQHSPRRGATNTQVRGFTPS